MPDLITLLHRYGDTLDEAAPVITTDDLTPPVGLDGARRRAHPALVAVAAAIVILAVVTGAVLLVSGPTAPPVTNAPTSVVSSTSTSVPPSTTLDGSGATSSTIPVTVGTPPGGGPESQPEDARAALYGAVLEFGELVELPVLSIVAEPLDGTVAAMRVRALLDTGQPSQELPIQIAMFDTPAAASTWLSAQTHAEDQDFNDEDPLPPPLGLGDESGVEQQCGRGCTTTHFVRVGAFVIGTTEQETFDVAQIAQAATTAVTTDHSPTIELTSATPTADPPEWLALWIFASDANGATVEWRVPDPEFRDEQSVGENPCHVGRLIYGVDGFALASEHYRATSNGEYERRLGTGFPPVWESAAAAQPPLDDVASLCPRSPLLPAFDGPHDYAPSAWRIGAITADDGGSYAGTETIEAYRLDSDQLVAAGLLPADNALPVESSALYFDSLRLVLRGLHGDAQHALGLTLRELDPDGEITVVYMVGPG